MEPFLLSQKYLVISSSHATAKTHWVYVFSTMKQAEINPPQRGSSTRIGESWRSEISA
jgi:hypothetical protein